MLIKQKESISSQKLGSREFWGIPNSSLFNGLEVWSSASDKAKLFAKTFSKNSNLDDSGISLPIFLSRTNLKLHISVTPKMIKKVNESWFVKSVWSWFIPVVVLKYCEPELSYILAELFNKCLKSLVFQIFGRSHCWSLYLGMLGRCLQLKTTAVLFFCLWLAKSLKNL